LRSSRTMPLSTARRVHLFSVDGDLDRSRLRCKPLINSVRPSNSIHSAFRNSAVRAADFRARPALVNGPEPQPLCSAVNLRQVDPVSPSTSRPSHCVLEWRGLIRIGETEHGLYTIHVDYPEWTLLGEASRWEYWEVL